MLFISEALHEVQTRLARAVEEGRITQETACRQILDLDPDDNFALQLLGQALRERGDTAGAEQCFRRAVEANPWEWTHYLYLAQLTPTQDALGNGWFELVCRKILLDDEVVASKEVDPFLNDFPDYEGMDLDRRTKFELLSDMLLERCEQEPPEVTDRLLPYRLIHQVHEATDLDAEQVNDLIQAGPMIVPLLVGTLRAWARSVMPEDTIHIVENTLALLGEIGDTTALPQVAEFLSLEDLDIAAAAGWAFDRIVHRNPRDSAPVIAGLIPALDAADRIALATRLTQHPALDPDGRLIASLGEDLGGIPREVREALCSVLVGSMIHVHGRPGVEMARQLLRRSRSFLSGKARRECEQYVARLEEVEEFGILLEPSPWTVFDICAGEAVWDTLDPFDSDADPDLDDLDSDLDPFLDPDDEMGTNPFLYDDDEALLLPEGEAAVSIPEPVQRVHKPSRNEPCWCGSGRKYKRCHLESDQRGDHAPVAASPKAAAAKTATPNWDADYTRQKHAPASQFDSLRSRIGRFVTETVSTKDRALAIQEFFGQDVRQLDYNDNMVLMDWVVHDWIAPTLGCRWLTEFLRRHGSSLSPRQREIVESWSQTFISLYEVQDVQAGRGCWLKNLLANETVFVHDISLSKSQVRWNGLLARIIDGDRGREMTGVAASVPRRQLEAMRQWMEDDHRATGWEWPEYLKRHWPRIRRKLIELYSQQLTGLQLVNNDGERILFSKSLYQILDGEALVAALQGCSVLSEDDRGTHYTWLSGTAARDEATVLGSIGIQGSQLALDCNSKERGEEGKKLLAGIAGNALRHVRDEFTTQKDIKRKAAEGSPDAQDTSPDAGNIPPEVGHALVTKVLEKHYSEWPGMALPALDGKTPRQAVQTAEGRRKVVELLRQIENTEERNRQNGRPFYNVARLREDLGVKE